VPCVHRDDDSTVSLGNLFQCLKTLSVKKFFLLSNPNLSWCNLRPFPLVLSLATCEKRATASFQVVVGSSKASPQPPFLWAKQPEFPSATPHKPCSLDPASALLPFSGHAPAPQCPSCSEGPKTEHSVWGAVSSLLSPGVWSLP